MSSTELMGPLANFKSLSAGSQTQGMWLVLQMPLDYSALQPKVDFYLWISHLHILFIKTEKVHYLTVQQMIEQKHLSRNQ